MMSWFDTFWYQLELALANMLVPRAARVALYFQLQRIFGVA
jgi:hypothetical protein